MRKRLALFLVLILVLSFVFTSCGEKKEVVNEEVKVVDEEVKEDPSAEDTESEDDKEVAKANEKSEWNVVLRGGTPALTMGKMMEDNELIDGRISLNYSLVETPDILTSKVLSAEADVAIVPSNFAAIQYNKGLGYKICGTSVWGSLYIVSTENVEKIEDLKGKELYSFGKGLTPDIVLRYILTQKGIDPDTEISINYLDSATSIAPAIISGKAKNAIVPEPLATMITIKNEEAKIPISLNELWKEISEDPKGYPQACLIIKSELIENEAEAVADFLDKYKDSIDWAKNNTAELAELSEKLELGVPKPAILKSGDRLNIGNFDISDNTNSYLKYFDMLTWTKPKSTGGKTPDEEIFYSK